MRYPKSLQDHGTIGFVAPSFGCATQPYTATFENAQKVFKELGYQLKLGPNCYKADGIGISNRPKLCAQELNEMYCMQDVDVIISCGGGELMCEILDDVDFNTIRTATPKWYMGYSDNTNFTFLETILCDTASIYGPCVGAFGMEPWADNVKDALAVLRGEKLVQTGYPMWEKESLKSEENPLATLHLTEPRVLKCFDATGSLTNTVEISGRLIGGCLDTLVNLAGTKFDKTSEFAEQYKEDGIVWFLESCDLNVFSIRRAMWQLEHAGWFAYTKGFLIGRPLVHGQEIMGLDQYQAVLEITKKLQVPVIMDADLGHIPPAMPLICGSYANVACKGQELTVDMQRI